MTETAPSPTPHDKPSADVPSQVFENFLQALRRTGEAEQVVARLRQVLLGDKAYSEAALRSAIFPAEETLG